MIRSIAEKVKVGKPAVSQLELWPPDQVVPNPEGLTKPSGSVILVYQRGPEARGL